MFKFLFNKKDNYQKQLEHFLGFKINNISFYKEAFTHSSQKANYNYQRLEFLGDAVLSLVIATYLFKKYPNLSEGELSKLRTKLVNKNILKEVAFKLHLDKWIKHQLKDTELEKSSIYCDIVESLIGAIYLDKGLFFAEEFIKNKILEQLEEVTEIEDTDYKSQILRLAQKYKWKIKYHIEDIQKDSNQQLFKVALFLNDEKISEGVHYNKKQAEQLASLDAIKKLNIVE